MTAGFLRDPQPGPDADRMFAGDLDDPGYVMNLTRVWAHAPELDAAWTALATAAAGAGGLGFRDKGVVVSALAAELGDAYCSLAWGARLAKASDPETARAVLEADAAARLDDRERLLAAWARRLVRDPNSTTAADVEALRAAGLDDRAILGLTAYVAARIAFSTINDALGAAPDAQLRASAPDAVRDAVTWGRPADR